MVAWNAKQALSPEMIEVAPPKIGEVRVKILATGVCHTVIEHFINSFAFCIISLFNGN